MEILMIFGIIFLIMVVIGFIMIAVKAIFEFIIGFFYGLFEMIVWLFQKLGSFIVRHIKIILGISLVALVVTLLAAYIRLAEEPFAFVPRVWNYIMEGHNLPGMIAGGVTILGVCWMLTALGMFLSSEILKMVNGGILLFFLVLAIVNRIPLFLSVNYLVCLLLFEGYIRGMRRIFGTEDMKHTVPKRLVCLAWNYVSMLYGVMVLQFPIEMWNQKYSTDIQPQKALFILILWVNLLLCISAVVVIRGYLRIRKTVEKLGIFDYSDILEVHREQYGEEYVIAVLEHMGSLVQKSMLCENEWMTKKYLLFWEKKMQQGKTMKEIEYSYFYSLHNHVFRELYVHMYQYFHNVLLNFPKVYKEKDIYYKRETMFQMYRYQLEEHPVLNENEKFINIYLLNRDYYIRQFYRNCSKNKEASEPEFMRLRWLNGLCSTKKQKEHLKKLIKKQNYLDKSLKQGQKDYQFLLLLEIVYFVYLLFENPNESFLFEWLEELAGNMGVPVKKNVFLYRFFTHGISSFDRDKLKEVYEEYKTCFQDELPEYFVKQVIKNAEYVERKETHIAICATVSSGKSTFLNTILGKDLMPNRMTACTARMSVIRTNDHLAKPISVVEHKNKDCLYEYDITSEKMDEINANDQVKRVLTEISVPLFQNADKILYFHDSPGVNNSMNETHHEVTLNFLKTEKPEWILLLIDAQQDTVNDNINLLKEVAEHVEKKSNVVFLYNKVDCLEEEDGDDLDENLGEVKKMIQEQGFFNPQIFPVSAKAAQLFSAVLEDRACDFTIEDERLFGRCYRFFKKKKNDMTRYFEEEISAIRNREYDSLDKEQIVMIKNKEYSKGEVLEAWYRTGVYAVTEWILQYIAGKEENS